MKKPSKEDIYKCLEIRKRSKQGNQSSIEEHKFCCKIFKKYEEWYTKTERLVFIDTMPLGSNNGQYDKEREEIERECL